jgi:protease YdgD
MRLRLVICHLLVSAIAVTSHAAVAQTGKAGHPPKRATASRHSQDARAQAPAAAAPAPDPTRKEFIAPGLIEDRVASVVAEKCPSSALTDPTDEGRRYLTGFDATFRPMLEPLTDPVELQVNLEAYRRCIDRAIAAIQALPHYALAGDQDDDCFDCNIVFANVALQIPRLREIKGLSYLVPPNLGDQDPKAAAAEIRRAIDDFRVIQEDFRAQAEAVIDRRQRVVSRRRNAAIEAANRAAMTATIAGIAGAGLGMAMGLPARQSAQIAQQNTMQQYGVINQQLSGQLAKVNVQQAAITGASDGLFSVSPDGGWTDDGIRVTLPRFLGIEDNGSGREWGGVTGALSNALPARFLVHVLVRLDSRHAAACTGTLVAPRLVLTNRHCVQNIESQEFFEPDQFSVRWEYHTVKSAGVASSYDDFEVQEVFTSDRATPLRRDEINDWAFLLLKTPFSASGIDLVSPEELAKHPNFRAAVAGYSGDLNHGGEITMDWGCLAHWDRSGMIQHRCRTFHGASGSPIVAVDGTFGRLRVVGVNAATAVGGEIANGPVPNEAYAGALKIGTGSSEMYATYQALIERYGR